MRHPKLPGQKSRRVIRQEAKYKWEQRAVAAFGPSAVLYCDRAGTKIVGLSKDGGPDHIIVLAKGESYGEALQLAVETKAEFMI
jgi:hypothetical protein